jgi:ankyrin repeat protein
VILLAGQGPLFGNKFTFSVHWAANNGHAGVLRALLKYGAKKDLKTKKGALPIDLAKSDEVKNLLSGKLEQINEYC